MSLNFDENNYRLTRCTRCAKSRYLYNPISVYIPHAFLTLKVQLIRFQVPREAYAILNKVICVRTVVLAQQGNNKEMPKGSFISEDLAKQVRELNLKITSLARVCYGSEEPSTSGIMNTKYRSTYRHDQLPRIDHELISSHYYSKGATKDRELSELSTLGTRISYVYIERVISQQIGTSCLTSVTQLDL